MLSHNPLGSRKEDSIFEFTTSLSRLAALLTVVVGTSRERTRAARDILRPQIDHLGTPTGLHPTFVDFSPVIIAVTEVA
jgi:hypothetical protein